MSKRALVIPDLQIGHGRPLYHLEWCSKFIADKQFDIIIQVGDWADFKSLSSYDAGKASAENRRFSKDWDAFRKSVDVLQHAWYGKGKYRPRMVYTAGNHEFRANRFMDDNPAIDMLPDCGAHLRTAGWETYEFLEVAKVEQVQVSHLFPRSLGGRISKSGLKYGAPSPEHQIRANMASCIAGHRPGYAHGTFSTQERRYHSLICGSFYPWKEEWMGPRQDNNWSGVVVLNQLKRGEFDPCPVRLDYLRKRYCNSAKRK
jgi:hypothetical protein